MKKTNTILDKIVESKKKRLSAVVTKKSYQSIKQEVESKKARNHISFFEALKTGQRIKIIAEIKKSSPSAGLLRDPFDLSEINKIYQNASPVAAISVITEEDFFAGNNENLVYIVQNNTNNKPILRKDFIFDPYQIYETKLIGAHAYLLIAALFDQDELSNLVDLGISLGLEPLIEITSEVELASATNTKARCIGVNSRDLKTFKTDKSTHELLRKVDPKYVRVAESAISNQEQLKYLSEFSDASLIGTYFMKSDDIGQAISTITSEVGLS